ncbi:hypothetical protein K402DRAFT_462695 [Aulographum hederae CBS 113979]|uniref:EKC/KEOPS complex subunit BUD32 n=1 Tax=Aulographum hederae CBS 113979 TaxID=1176131 RepID=A0A6G1H2T4_9PEZI|nr:hypothetical protein K402DRAFT_462695 [Aulographum hederae CBS 113979]
MHSQPMKNSCMTESIQKMKIEVDFHRFLVEHRHPNIIHTVLCVREGIFMQRYVRTLQVRLLEKPTSFISETMQFRWIKQIAAALSWIEQLGYVHGDLRLGNILLDAAENIFLTDFDGAVKSGEEMTTANCGFCPMREGFKTLPAGPVTEQFTLASCIYSIRFGKEPWSGKDGHAEMKKLVKGETPDTGADVLFSDLIQGCCRGAFGSVREVQEVILDILTPFTNSSDTGSLAHADDNMSVEVEKKQRTLLAECEDFLQEEEKKIYESERARGKSRQYRDLLERWSKRVHG